jgi:hypothetical protein
MRFAVTTLLTLGTVVWQASAFASATFPQRVDTDLTLVAPGLVENIDPPGGGCTLCHLSSAGGSGTNNVFGSMMKHAGCRGTITGSVDGALIKLEVTAPRAIADIRMGTDPNTDPLAVSGDPIPEYGCGSIAGAAQPANSGRMPLLGLGAVGLCLLRRRTARRPKAHD